MSAVFPADIRRCAHRKTNGEQCGSPAMKNQPLCYFHDRYREQHVDIVGGRPLRKIVDFEVPVLEDANAIQIALTKVFQMLLAGVIEPKYATPLISCLRIASQNLHYTNFNPRMGVQEFATLAPAPEYVDPEVLRMGAKMREALAKQDEMLCREEVAKKAGLTEPKPKPATRTVSETWWKEPVAPSWASCLPNRPPRPDAQPENPFVNSVSP